MKQEYVLVGLFFALRTEHSGGSISSLIFPTHQLQVLGIDLIYYAYI